jgi:hypothetical protein
MTGGVDWYDLAQDGEDNAFEFHQIWGISLLAEKLLDFQ